MTLNAGTVKTEQEKRASGSTLSGMIKLHVNRSTLRSLGSFALTACLAIAGCAKAGGPLTAVPAGPAHVLAGANVLKFKVFVAGQTPGFPAGANAVDIVPGSSGDVWFTDNGTPAIGRISSNGKVTEFTAGLPPQARPYAIALGPDGNMWFSDYRGVAIGRITRQGKITEFSAPQISGEFATGIAFGADGEPWVLAFGPQPLLAHLTPQGKIALTRLPSHLSPDGSLASDASGNLWFMAVDLRSKALMVERPAQGGLVKVPTHLIKEFLPCCPNLAPRRAAVGPDGDLQFTTLDYGYKQSGASFIGDIGPIGITLSKVTQKGVPYPVYPSGIASDGSSLWLSGGDPFLPQGALWKVDAQGHQTAYPVPYDPVGLTADAHGNLWFTAAFTDVPSQIVRVTVR